MPNLNDQSLNEALDTAAEHGVTIDKTGTGPIFPAAEAHYIGSDGNVFAVMGVTVRAVNDLLRAAYVPFSTRAPIHDAIRADVFDASSYDDALANLIAWADQA